MQFISVAIASLLDTNSCLPNILTHWEKAKYISYMKAQQMVQKSASFSLAQNAQKTREEWVLQETKVYFDAATK